jgi:putative transposase
MRKELLNAYQFNSLREVRATCHEWQQDYNQQRSHKSLGYLSPVADAQRSSIMNLKMIMVITPYPQIHAGSRPKSLLGKSVDLWIKYLKNKRST